MERVKNDIAANVVCDNYNDYRVDYKTKQHLLACVIIMFPNW